MTTTEGPNRSDSCEVRIGPELQDRLGDMAAILRREDRASAVGDEDRREQNFQDWNEYPLSVSRTTLVKVQLSWGGPSDEFEVEIDEDGDIVAIRYRFLDWFDGAMRELTPGTDEFETAERFLSYCIEGMGW